MPDISKFKSVSVSTDTHAKLLSLAQNRFEVPVSVQKVIEYMLTKEIKKNAIQAFIDAKNIKNKYNLEDIDDSSSDEEFKELI